MFIIDELAMYNCPKGMNKVVLYCIVLYCIVLYCIDLDLHSRTLLYEKQKAFVIFSESHSQFG